MASDPAEKRNNNIVAESDLDAVVEALETRLSKALEANDSDPVSRSLLSECTNSMTRKLHKIVQPVSDEAFHLYVKRHCFCGPDGHVRSPVTFEEAASEFQEEELLDQEAWRKAQDLRQDIRDQASRVRLLRDAALAKSVDLAQRQVDLLTATTDLSNEQRRFLSNEGPSKRFNEMETSLASLMEAMLKTEQAIPHNMNSLQETIDVVRDALRKESISKVEASILSRSEPPPITSMTHTDDKNIGPDEVLARCIRQATRST